MLGKGIQIVRKKEMITNQGRGQYDQIWQKIRYIWQYFKGLFGTGQSCQPTLVQFVCI